MSQFDLARFENAQDGVFDTALAELRRGRKSSHWMWFVFPQLRGLGRSGMAWHFGIESLDEARDYLRHSLLGERLRRCVGVLQNLDTADAQAVFGHVDAVKLRSSLTLFERANEGDSLFAAAIDKWFGGRRDEQTLLLLDGEE